MSPVFADTNNAVPLSLLEQAKRLPREFSDHFFDVPLAVRVELNGRLLGEAMITLSRSEHLTLIDFTDATDAAYGAEERERWLPVLQAGMPLGGCQAECPQGLVALHYSLEASKVSILTVDAERAADLPAPMRLPEQGSHGLMLRNLVNISGGQQQSVAGRYDLQATSSLGNWTQTFNGQLAKLGGTENPLYHAVHDLYSQIELDSKFLRLGYFTPSYIGISRQPRSLGAGPETALGVMLGSSQALASANDKHTALYPIYLTANREAVAEVYRNDVLINSQAVAAGLQNLDTSMLPSGIYEVEVRLVEDGQVTSRSQELVYKPGQWRNPEQRLRYSGYVGRDSRLLNNWDGDKKDGSLTAGGALNYLLHPRLVGGVSARKVEGSMQYGTSLDWTASERATLFANLYQSDGHGTGADIQSLYHYAAGTLNLSHSRSWLDTRNTYEYLPDGTRIRRKVDYVGAVSNTSVSINHRLAPRNTLSARVAHSEGNTNGVGLDLNWLHSNRLFGSDSNWRISVFDRPGSIASGDKRNRGIDVGLSVALGGKSHQLSGTLGTRTARDGSADRNGSLTYDHTRDNAFVSRISATASADTYGTGLSGRAAFKGAVANGDAYMQRSSYNNRVSGGLNLESTLVLGRNGQAMLTGAFTGEQAGMIVDVESDIDGIHLRADDLSGLGAVLKPGRNFVPVGAYQAGSVQFDFADNYPPAAHIQPTRAGYHLNKGGVAYQKIRLVKTVTVLGRLVDAAGNPLKGHHVVNHASRGVSEVDGFFSMEMSEKTPTLEVMRDAQVVCRFALKPGDFQRENDVLMVGDLRCLPGSLAQVAGL
jgi:hypothetical protein